MSRADVVERGLGGAAVPPAGTDGATTEAKRVAGVIVRDLVDR